MILGIIYYGAAVWCTKEFMYIISVQLKAVRFFLDVGRYIPNAGVLVIGWDPVLAKQWTTVINE